MKKMRVCTLLAGLTLAVQAGRWGIATGNIKVCAARAGRDAVLLWASKPTQADAEMPKSELVDFASVELKPGESKTTEFDEPTICPGHLHSKVRCAWTQPYAKMI